METKTLHHFLALAILAGVSAASPYAQTDFVGVRRDLPVGATPRAIASGDLNGDGKIDLVVANGSSNDLSVLLAAGLGVFRPEIRVPTGGDPEGVVVGSFNSSTDANLDIAVAAFLEDRFQILLGNGAGGFSAPTSFSTGIGTGPKALSVLDWNLDGKKDLAVLLAGTNEVKLYNGDGLGGFSLHGTYPVGMGPAALVTGDWDGDGKTDMAVANDAAGTVTIYYGGPTGFQTCGGCVFTVAVNPNPTSITAGLLNSDAFPDLVLGCTGTDIDGNPLPASILLGDPDFGFTTLSSLVTGSVSYSVATGDFNGDAKRDIAVGLEGGGSPGTVRIFSGNGFGSFTQAGTFPVGSVPVGLAVADLAGSTAIDIATANTTAGSSSLLVNDGTGVFTATPVHALAAGSTLSAMDAVDFSGDGKVDIAVAQTDLNQVNILLGTGSGTFTTGTPLTLPGNQPGDAQAFSLLVRNFTPDSNLDVVTLNAGFENVSLFPGNGNGTFGTRSDHGLGNSCNISNGSGCISPESLAAGPLNDTDTTRPDLVVSNPGGDTAFPYGSVSILLQSGSSFGAATRYAGGNSPICSQGLNQGSPCVANSDCSGTCSVTTTTLCLLDSDCPSGETCLNPGSCTTAPFGAAVGTVDAGTARDLVVANDTTRKASFLPGSGTGAFSTIGASSSTGVGPRAPILADIDKDTDLDLIVMNSLNDTISVYLGDGTGSFAPAPSSPRSAGASPWRGRFVDLNQDGWEDLAVTDLTGGSITLLMGDGTGRFGLGVRLGVGGTPRDIATADFNGDGKPDLAAASEADGTISILLNTSVDPTLSVTQVGAGTRVSWNPFFEASAYDVIRGQTDQVTQTATEINLGPVVCVENDSPNTDTAGTDDLVNPASGKVFFYLFRNVDPFVKGSYGRSTAGKIRIPGSGDCL